jgi:DHA3 family tetracycline resistance protein-like MFS transporter
MFTQVRSRTDPYKLYISIDVVNSFVMATAYTTAIVYRVRSGHLNPLQLVLLGTMLEISYLVMQLPSGVLADLVSRRLCVIAGQFLEAVGTLMQGLSPHFAVQLTAQIPVGFGAALTFGAQQAWLADEAGHKQLTSVFLRATQFALVGGLAGSMLSGLLALPGGEVPFLVGGGVLAAMGLALTWIMPETRFRPAARAAGLGGVARDAWGEFAGQIRKTHGVMVAVPGLVLLLGFVLFVGMWGESFDRLWGAYLLTGIRFPRAVGLDVVVWFSILAVARTLLSLGSTEWAKRRTSKLGTDSIAPTLLALTVATALAVVLMASTSAFILVVAAYLVVATLRPVFSPLVTGWVVGRVDSSVCATALSATDLLDSAGQIVGGPIVGAIGVLASVRAALLAGGVALGPAAALLAAAARQVRLIGVEGQERRPAILRGPTRYARALLPLNRGLGIVMAAYEGVRLSCGVTRPGGRPPRRVRACAPGSPR